MREHRALLGIVGLLALGGISGCGAVSEAKATNAVNASGVTVEVSPNRTSPGLKVAVRANCRDNTSPATATSKAFPPLTLRPAGSLLSAEVQIPTTTPVGTFDVTVTCRNGATAVTKLVIVGASARPTVGPHTGGGFLSGGEGESLGPAVWFGGAAGVFLVAGVLSAVSTRRRRRNSVNTREEQRTLVDR